ncbi:cytochrome P450 [Cytidiella melzeri]|nr:cytochrome P450 [Cytidiella melzeri]
MTTHDMVHTVCAASAGFISWILLNRHPIRGDHGVLLFTFVFSLLYYQVRATYADIALRRTLEIAGSYTFTLAAATVAYRLSPFHPLASYPGPLLWRISSVVLAVVSFRGHRHLVLDALHKRYGRFVRIGPNALSINSCGAFQTIYGPAHHFTKSESYELPGHVGGTALFFRQTRDAHTARKQIWSQAFSPSALDNFFPPLERRTWQLTECIEKRANGDGIVDLAECICHWSYDFMSEMVFSGSSALELMKNGDQRGLIMGGKKATVIVDSFGQTPWLLDILWHIPGGGAMHSLRQSAASMMRTRVQASHVKIRDLTSYLLDGHPRTGEQICLSDLELDAIVAIQGGSDNTGTTMALAIYFMLSSPSTYKTLQAALDEAFPDPLAPLDRRTLASIPILDAVLNEALRLGSPFFLPRVVPPGGTVIEGAMIPGGTTVALAAYSQQVAEENFFPDPLTFRAERWLPEGLGPGSVTNKAALFSFSTGPDMCIAKSFAMHEMRLCLSRLVLTFDMTLPEGFDVDGFYRGLRNMRTTLLDEPLMVKAVRRKGRQTPLDVC